MIDTRLVIQKANFNVGEQYEWLVQCQDDGAVVTFTGKVVRCVIIIWVTILRP